MHIEQLPFTVNQTAASYYNDKQTAFELLQKQTNLSFSSKSDGHSANEIVAASSGRSFIMYVEKEIDKSSQKEHLLKELDYYKGFLASVEKKLQNERFVQNAKPEVVEMEKKKKADSEAKIKSIEESIASL